MKNRKKSAYIDSVNRSIYTIVISFILLLVCFISLFFQVGKHGKIFVEYSVSGLIVVLIIIILISLFRLQRDIIKPYNQLYSGFSDIGLSSLIALIENINNNASFTETLQFINRTFSSFIPYNYIGIALISEDKKSLKASYGVSDESIIGLPEKIMGATWPIKDTSLKDLILSGRARIINDLEEYCSGKQMKIYNQFILDAGIKASITLPLKVSGEPIGVIFFSSANKNVYNEGHVNFLRTLANSIAISLNQNIFVSEIIYSSVYALAKLAETRDEDTGEHLMHMSLYSRLIAEHLYENDIFTEEITLEYIDQLERFSSLHDIGKVGVRDSILQKPGKLTDAEFEEIKMHASFGAEVLKSAESHIQKKGKSLFAMGIDIALGHHEKWDGSGYPNGKKELEIPLCARIVAVADVFDALTSHRPYKNAYPLEQSFRIMEEGRGKHFDPIIIDIFLKNRNRIEELYHSFQDKTEEKVG